MNGTSSILVENKNVNFIIGTLFLNFSINGKIKIKVYQISTF